MRLLAFIFLLSPFLYAEGTSTKSPQRPNVILINVDDLGWAELGSYGQEKIKTPHLDNLAAQGQRWTQFYSGAPVCAPSRNVLMTGRHTGGCDVQNLLRVNNKETWDDLQGDWPVTEKTYTLASAMKKAGYSTGGFGKWGLGEYGTTGAPDKHGFDRFYGYTDHRLCHTYYPKFLWKDGKKVIINEKDIPGHARQPEGEVKAETYRSLIHASEVICDEAVKFVEEKAKSKEPFFMYFAPLEAHVAMQPLQNWVDEYPNEWDKEPYRGNKGYLPHPRPRAAYAGMISQMDHNVGRVLETLKKQGLDDNTIIMFTSDNGTTHDVGGVDHQFFNSVKDLKGLKGQLYEGGIRVPYIVVWKGKIKPGTIDQPGYGADIMPTICSLVEADAGDPTGIDLSEILIGKKSVIENRRPMVWTGGGYGGQVAVRFGDFKVLRKQLQPGPKNKPQNWEVYNIKNDPNEKQNIASDHKDLIEKAKTLLDKEYIPAKGFPKLNYDAHETASL